MRSNNTGGSAFQMTLRDWFAGQALTVAQQEVKLEKTARENDPWWEAHDIAQKAYELADAMLAINSMEAQK